MRFYIGQPVVSLNDDATWRTDLVVLRTIANVPQLGARYTVHEYCRRSGYEDYLILSQIVNTHPWGELWFHEGGFAPVTEDLVKSIISKSLHIREPADVV